MNVPSRALVARSIGLAMLFSVLVAGSLGASTGANRGGV
jgi:hypothetical protein